MFHVSGRGKTPIPVQNSQMESTLKSEAELSKEREKKSVAENKTVLIRLLETKMSERMCCHTILYHD